MIGISFDDLLQNEAFIRVCNCNSKPDLHNRIIKKLVGNPYFKYAEELNKSNDVIGQYIIANSDMELNEKWKEIDPEAWTFNLFVTKGLISIIYGEEVTEENELNVYGLANYLKDMLTTLDFTNKKILYYDS